MFKNKSEVDRHVQNCLKKVNNETERNLRCFSFAKLYFNVGDYEQAYRYISSYLLTKPKSPEGHHLLAKSLEKLGKLDSALEAYKTSLQLDPKQNNVIIKVCEILSSDNIELDLSGARYFCELAQSFDPNNPAVYSLKEKLITIDNENPFEVSQLLLKELETRPADINLRIRLLKHFTQNNMIQEAYKHATSIEHKDFDNFHRSISWYENFMEILLRYQKDVPLKPESTWEFWLQLVSVMERLVALRLDDRNNFKGSTDYLTALFNFDQTLRKAVENVDQSTDRQLVSTFITHYHLQLHFHISTLILKQAKRDIIQFKEASHIVLPALFTAYSPPPDIQSVWFTQSTEKTRKIVHRWYKAACFRCSQVGHILLAIAKDNKSVLLEKAAQYSSGLWREQLYKKIFVKREQHNKISSSAFAVNTPSLEPTLKLPISSDLSKYDEVAQLTFPDSLHHYVWIYSNSDISETNLVAFEGMQYSIKNLSNCSAESLNLLDIYAFIYCATLCAKTKSNDNKVSYYNLLPASITENLATTEQSAFIECVYKMYKNLASSHLADIRLILIRGIETVRCVGHHGLDARTLVNLASIFKERSSKLAKQSEIDFAIARAELYWKTALPLLEKIANDQKISYVRNRLFESGANELTAAEAANFIERGKLFTATQLKNKKCYDEALIMFEQLKDPYASFYQYEIYKQFAFNKMDKKGVENEIKSDIAIILTKARDCLYLTLDRLREPLVDASHPLNAQLGSEIDKIERMLSNMESGCNRDIASLSEENRSFDISVGEEYLSSLTHNNSYLTTKSGPLNQSTPLRLNASRQEARPSPERLDAQIRQMMTSRDALFAAVSEQNRRIAEAQNSMLEKLNGVVDDLKSIKKEVESLKEVSKTVNDIKNSVEDFQNVVDAVQEMKKELSEFKKPDAKNQLSDEDLYVLDTDYGVDYNIPSNIGSYPPIVPGSFPNYQPNKMPNPNHLPTYAPAMLYPGLYPGLPYPYGGLNLPQPGTLPFLPDQQQSTSVTVSTAHHLIPSQTSLSQHFGLDAALNVQALPSGVSQQKELPKTPSLKLPTASSSSPIVPAFGKAPPVNVVITTSDPLPAENTLTSQPVLSVTIPPQHIKSNFFKPATATSVANKSDKSNEKLMADRDKRLNETSGSLNRSDLSNYSPEEHEPNVDFKPVVPLPDEVPVNTGEEGETELFCGRAKLFRHANVNGVKEWKERGVGNLKILKNEETGKTRILMRRDQVFKICANHFITKEMSLHPSANNDKAFTWAAQDFSDGEIKPEMLCVKFKSAEDAKKFAEVFKSAAQSSDAKLPEGKKETKSSENGAFLGGFVFTSTPTFLPKEPETVAPATEAKETNKNSPFSTFCFGKPASLTLTPSIAPRDDKPDDGRSSPVDEEFVPTAEFKPVVDLPELIDIKTGEENSEVLFEERAKLFRFVSGGDVSEWKERGIGTLKILKDDSIRLLMRREQVHKVCCNHRVLKDMIFKINSNNPKAVVWRAQDFSEGVIKTEMFTARFKTEQIANDFLSTLQKAKDGMDESGAVKRDSNETKETFGFAPAGKTPSGTAPDVGGFGDAFKIKPGSWECQTCMVRNDGAAIKCVACDSTRKDAVPDATAKNTQKLSEKKTPSVSGFGDAFKIKPGSWECQSCMIRNEADVAKCVACGSGKEGGLPEKETAKNVEPPAQKFVFGIPTNTKLSFSGTTNTVPAAQNTKWTFGIPKTEATPLKPNEVTPFKPNEATPFKPKEETKISLESVDKFPNQNSFSFISPTKQEFEFKQKPPKKISPKNNDDSEDGSYVEEEEDNIYFKPVIPLPDKIQVKTGEEDDEVLYCHKAKLYRFVDGEWKERGLGDIKILKNKSNGTLRVLMRRIQVLKICLNHLLTKNIDYKFKDEKSLLFTAADFSEGTLVNQLFCVRFKNSEIAQDFKRAVENALGSENPSQQEDNKSRSDDGVEIIFETKVTPEEEQEAIRLGLPPKFMSYKQLPDCNCEQCKKDDEYLKDLFPKETPASSTTNLNDKQSINSKSPINVRLKPSVLVSPNNTPPETVATTFSWPSSTTANLFSFSNVSFGNSFLPQSDKSENGTPKKEITTAPKIEDDKGDGNKGVFSFQNNLFKTSNIFAQTPTSAPVFGQNTPNAQNSIFGQNKTPTIPAPKSASLFGQNVISSNSPTPSNIVFGQNVAGSDSSSTLTPTTTIFGQNLTSSNPPITQTPKIAPIFGQNLTSSNPPITQTPKIAPIFGQSDATSNSPSILTSTNASIFEPNITISTLPSTQTPKNTIFGQNIATSTPPSTQTPKTSIFGQNIATSDPLSTQTPKNSIFGGNLTSSSTQNVFGANNKSANMGSIFDIKPKATEGNEKTGFLFGQNSTPDISATTKLKETDEVVLKSDPNLTFASLAATTKGAEKPAFIKKDETFSFLGAGTPVFGSTKTPNLNTTKNESEDEHNNTSSTTEEYDPHYEPIIPLPDAITVTTGEENETVLFNERAKLFRYDSGLKEWKERGVGQFKVLHHPEKNTYRLLLRREQVFKVVLNQLITPNFELQPMVTSDKAWIWAGYNYSEEGNAFEKLAIRFKNQQLAAQFYNLIKDVVRKLEVASNVPQDIPTAVQNFNVGFTSAVSDPPVETAPGYEYEYDEDDDEDGEVDDEDDERSVMFMKECALSELNPSGDWDSVGEGYVEVCYDPELFAARIIITDNNGSSLSNTLIGMNTEMEIITNECIWKSVEWGDGNIRWRNLKVVFGDDSAAQEFHSNYLEGLNFAQQSGLVDELPIEDEHEPED